MQEFDNLRLNFKLLSTNQAYKKSKWSFYMTAKGKQFKANIHNVLNNLPHIICYTCKVVMKIELGFNDSRKHDIDNVKVLIDAFNGYLYEDDSLIMRLKIKKIQPASCDYIHIQVYPF